MALRILFIICVFFIYAIHSTANPLNSTWIIDRIEGGGTLTLIDDARTVGEEMVYITVAGNTTPVKLTDISVETYGGNIYLETEDGEPHADMSVEIMTGSRYQHMLLMLKDDAFRSGFKVLPKSCPHDANAFLLISDNLQGEAYGYCLVPLI